jgi:hypothetical protein
MANKIKSSRHESRKIRFCGQIFIMTKGHKMSSCFELIINSVLLLLIKIGFLTWLFKYNFSEIY